MSKKQSREERKAKMAAIRARLSEGKKQILQTLLDTSKDSVNPNDGVIKPRTSNDAIPLSFAQQRFWFLDQYDKGSANFNIANAVRLTGALRISALEKAVHEITTRHESLRTRFVQRGETATQVIDPSYTPPLPVTDLQGLPEEKRESLVERLSTRESLTGFDLENGPLLRNHLLIVDRDHHVLLINMHHIISDAWSLGFFTQELSILYQAFAEDRPSPLEPLSLQYADFAVWQRNLLRGDYLTRQVDYWRKQFGGEVPVLDLPLDKRRPPIQTYNGNTHEITISEKETAALTKLAGEENASLFMGLLAVWQIMLAQYSGQSRVIVGTPIANRNHPGLESIIGAFVNTLALSGDLSGDPKFLDFLRTTRDKTLDAFAHQDMPFEKLVEELQPVRDMSRPPIFQVVLVLQNVPDTTLNLPDLVLEGVASEEGSSAKYDLTFTFGEQKGVLYGSLNYNVDLFETETAVRLVKQFHLILKTVLKEPTIPLSRIPLQGHDSRRLLLGTWNDTETVYPRESPIHRLFEAWAERTPDAEAMIQAGEAEALFGRRLSYGDLNAAANRLARTLQAQGVTPDMPVGVCIERNLTAIVALLAVLKAGGAYVPLDPEYPSERLTYMLSDSGITTLIAESDILDALPAFELSFINVIIPSESWEEIGHEEADNLPLPIDADYMAYIMYTSGSTGKPKGTQIIHRNVVRLVQNTNFLPFESKQTWLHAAPISFDASTLEVWGPLLSGARCVLYPERVPQAATLAAIISDHEIDTLWLTSSLFNLMVEQAPACLSGIKHLITGGDVMSPTHARKALELNPELHLVNGYGPTENTTFSTCYSLPRDLPQNIPSIPIGGPISNTRAFICNPDLRPVAIGAIGELLLAGDGLARGYLNLPEMTAERFIPNPFTERIGKRLYRTGDKARFLSDGRISFLGRVDHQVKLRGFRIELREIESCLQQHPTVHEAVAMAREDRPGDKRLVVYARTGDNESSEPIKGEVSLDLRRYLEERLPEFMVPNAVVTMDRFPLNANGKVIRDDLPQPEIIGSEAEDQQPQTPLQEKLAAIWRELLGVQQIGIRDNFFELGGHSLLATQVVSRLNETYNVNLPLRVMFEQATLATLAGHLEQVLNQDTGAGHRKLEPVPRETLTEPLPLSLAQQRLWFLSKMENAGFSYNVPFALALRGALNITALERCMDTILARHESLRTSFPSVQGQPTQAVHEHTGFHLPVIDLTVFEAGLRPQLAQQLATIEAQQPFNLERGPLFRMHAIRVAPDHHVLLLSMDHIVSDGWSLGVLVREIVTFYQTYLTDAPVTLDPLTIQYADYAYRQREWVAEGMLDEQLTYWRQQLADIPALVTPPADRPRPAVQTFNGANYGFTLPPELADRLKKLGEANQTTPFMTLLAGFYALLSRYIGSFDIPVGSPVANRNHKELEQLIGFFVNTLVMRGDLSDNPSFGEILQRTRKLTLDAFANGDAPFDQVVELMKPERDPSHGPLFQISFILQNAPVDALTLPGLALEPVSADYPVAKCDLTAALSEAGDTIVGSFEYNTDLFDKATMARMSRHYLNLLQGAAANPDTRLADLPLLDENERRHILYAWNADARELPRSGGFPQMVQKRVETDPDAVALSLLEGVEGQQKTWSYATIWAQSGAMAAALTAKGVRPNQIVGVCLERGADAVISAMAVWRAGGVYLPLDPTYPAARLRFILEDSTPFALISRRGHAALFEDAVIYEPDELRAEIEAQAEIEISPLHNAYMIYTSGSTGQPKGALLHHLGLCNLAQAQARVFNISQMSRVLQFASLSFDASISEIASAWGSGATLCMADSERLMPGFGLANLLNTMQISHATLPPSALSLLPNIRFAELDTLIVAGEACPPELAAYYARHHHFFNAYGPTEATVCTTIKDCDGFERKPPIGKPIDNCQVYLLDPHLQPVPIGVTGELYIGGVSLGRGYHARPDLTAERFIPNPFAKQPGQRLYRSGDAARYLPNGDIDFLERVDQQVKLRGFRIEIGEIETAMTAMNEVAEAVVMLWEADPQNKQLVGFAVPTKEIEALTPSLLRRRLQERLPEYMVPSTVTLLSKLPLTPNGKVDRPQLLNSLKDSAPASAAGHAPPRNETEARLALIWRETLKRDVIGIRQSFFDLGGHSLLAVRMIAGIRETFNLELPVGTVFRFPTIESLAAEVDRLTATLSGDRDAHVIKIVSRDAPPPLSFAQQRLWFLGQFEDMGAAYNMPAFLRAKGRMNVDALTRAIAEIVRRHEVFRTTFPSQEGQPYQRISQVPQIKPTLTDLTSLADGETAATALAKVEASKPFDLAIGPLLRVNFLRLAEADHIILVNMHHIISDGWSVGILIRELSALYAAFSTGQPSPLAEPPVQYADYAHFQRVRADQGVFQAQLDYWKTQLASRPGLTELPYDHPRPAVQTYNGGSIGFTVPMPAVRAIGALCRNYGATRFMAFEAIFAALLARYSGQDDISVGTPVANRSYKQIENLIGFFVNTLVLRTRFDETQRFQDLLTQTVETAHAAYANQEVPFERVVEAVQPERITGHTPLFQAMCVLQDAGSDSLILPGLEMEGLAGGTPTAKFDLTLHLTQAGEHLAAGFEFNTDIFEVETIQRLGLHYGRLCEAFAEDPARLVASVPLLTAGEKAELLSQWHTVNFKPVSALPIHQLFLQQAERTPDAVALTFEKAQVSYGVLAAESTRLGAYLRGMGVTLETPVAVCCERGPALAVSILAILHAGGVYVPIDPAQPAARLGFILEDSKAPIVLTDVASQKSLPAHDALLVCPEQDQAAINAQQAEPIEYQAGPDHGAYMIYTSGSTGKPKGVWVSHGNVTRLFDNTSDRFKFASTDVWTLFHSYAFDFSVWEIWGALLYGGRLVIVPKWTAPSAEDMCMLLAAQRVTVFNQTPSAFAAITRYLTGEGNTTTQVIPRDLRLIIFGGEALDMNLVNRWTDRFGHERPQLVNMYGITETTVHVTWRPLTQADTHAVGSMIGPPLPDLQLYVLDPYLEPVPMGITGELYVGGAGLARGYWGRAELSAVRFIPNPFSEKPGGRLYRSGDLARLRPQADLEYRGRLDHQVKVRGYRIELGEIKAVILGHAEIEEAVVTTSQAPGGDTRLIAYVVTVNRNQEPPVPPEDLRSYLREHLPEYMVPSTIMALAAIPVTANGKVDMKALPEPEDDGSLDFVPPGSDMEIALASIWAEVLERPRIGVHDNFFDLGGHSLLATRVISRIRESFSVDVPLRDLFAAPTVAGLTAAVQKAMSQESPAIPESISPRKETGPVPLSFAQERLWFLAQLEGPRSTYNIPTAIRLKGNLAVDVLFACFNQIVARHENLRTNFAQVDNRPVQIISPEKIINPPMIDLSGLDAQRAGRLSRQLTNQMAAHPFNLEHQDLIRVGVIRMAGDDHILAVTMHHLISDAWSMAILIREMTVLFETLLFQRTSPLKPPAIQYADFAVWQRGWFQGSVLEAQRDYWRGQLAGAPPLLDLPTDRPRPAIHRYRGSVTHLRIDADITERLRIHSRQSGSTLFMSLLAVFALQMSRYSGQDDVVVGSPIANRNHKDMEDILGFFVNTLVLRTTCHGNPSFNKLLARVRQATLGAYAHQDFPFSQIVEELQPERTLSYTPLFQVMFNLHNAPEGEMRLPGVEIAPMGASLEDTKYDLNLAIIDAPGELAGTLTFNTDLFEAGTVQRMVDHFRILLSGALDKPDLPVSRLSMLTDFEQRQMLVAWNDSRVPFRETSLFHQLFEATAQKFPDRTALAEGDETDFIMDYATLNARANQLAAFLRQAGITPEKHVGVCTDRSHHMILAMLGILKAGGAYVPLDPATPEARLRFLAEDAGLSLILTQTGADHVLEGFDAQVVKLDSDWAVVAEAKKPAGDPPLSPLNAAYTIYTSGSTGLPKGVTISHGAMTNYTRGMLKRLDVEGPVGFALVSTIAADLGMTGIVGAFATGGCLHVLSNLQVTQPESFAAYMEQRQVEGLKIVPSHLAALQTIAEPERVLPQKVLVLGGEASRSEWVENLRGAGNCKVYNHYGPTESTVGMLMYAADGDLPGSCDNLPLGRPVANTRAYVLDRFLQPVAMGVPGELCIAGAGLARGYAHRPDQTADKFVPDPFGPPLAHSRAGGRLYKTGDKVRVFPGGHIAFLGRVDHQVKLRGFRIELGEIESVLLQNPEIREACVLLHEAGGSPRLAAFIVAGIEREALDSFLESHLPRHMHPTEVVFMPHLPITANGKIDRKALIQAAERQHSKTGGNQIEAPTTSVQRTIAAIWREELGIENIGIHDNFFQLGGHSLMLIRVHGKLQQAFGEGLTTVKLFEHPTIASLAKYLGAPQQQERGDARRTRARERAEQRKQTKVSSHMGKRAQHKKKRSRG